MLVDKQDKELKSLLNQYGFLRGDELDLRRIWIADLQLNRFKLEKAAQSQSSKFERWYSLSEDLSALIKEKKRIFGKKEAILDLKIRQCTKESLQRKYGLHDLKESAIRSIIIKDSKIQKLKKNINFLETVYSKLRGVLEAARQRKSMIKILSDLYISSYWDKVDVKEPNIKKRRLLR